MTSEIIYKHNQSELEQHKEIYQLFSYVDEQSETVTLMQDFEYFRTHNSYRVILKGNIINPKIFMKLNKSNWEMNYILVQNNHLVLGLRPKSGASE